MNLNLTARPDNSPDYVRQVADALVRLFDYVRPAVTAVATDYTVAAANEVVLVDATTGNRVVNLPPAKGFAREVVTVVRVDASGNSVTIDADGAETINGAATKTVGAGYGAVRLVSTGVEWISV